MYINRILTALPGSVARAARKAAILSVVPADTTQSSGKPARKFASSSEEGIYSP